MEKLGWNNSGNKVNIKNSDLSRDNNQKKSIITLLQ